jgi:hypothetical protein
MLYSSLENDGDITICTFLLLTPPLPPLRKLPFALIGELNYIFMFRAPMPVRVLIKELLQRHPNDRPDVSLAATACQILLWAPDLCMVDNQQSCSLDNVKRY